MPIFTVYPFSTSPLERIDITNEEFWDVSYKQREKESFAKRVIKKNKILSISFLLFGVCAFVNLILIYSFLKILINI